ncbi:MAG: hypothetical protein KKD35_07860 [Elusimicrobia bacterium]|nr:hypothetical protein [Elusimicrobiota bacterium]
MINERIVEVKEVGIIDPSQPILNRSGDNLVLNNIVININGILAEPELTFKPYGISKNVLGIKIERAKLHVSMMPDKSAAPQFTQEEIMEKVMDVLMKTLLDALTKSLSAGSLPLKAEDIVTLTYNKVDWILRGEMHTEFIRNYLPPTLVGDVHFTGFSTNDSAIMVTVGTGK